MLDNPFRRTAEDIVPRDRNKWPLIADPADPDKLIPYRRPSGVAELLPDKYQLERWSERMVAKGVASDVDLADIIRVLDPEKDKRKLDEKVKEAKAAAKSTRKADIGTLIHRLTELEDTGQPVPPGFEHYAAHLDSYRQATASLRTVAAELFVVNDELGCAGTADRIVIDPAALGGPKLRIGDLKTGRWAAEYGGLAVAVQLAIYAGGVLYDPETRTRTALPPIDRETALLIHLPADTAECRVHEVDIEAGLRWAKLALDVVKARNDGRRAIREPRTFGAAAAGAA